MTAQEQELAQVARPSEVDDHHTVLRRLDPGLDVATQQDGLLIGQITEEDRVLDPFALAFYTCRDVAEPPIVADVVGD